MERLSWNQIWKIVLMTSWFFSKINNKIFVPKGAVWNFAFLQHVQTSSSISSLSFKATGLKFWIQTPHTPKKYQPEIGQKIAEILLMIANLCPLSLIAPTIIKLIFCIDTAWTHRFYYKFNIALNGGDLLSDHDRKEKHCCYHCIFIQLNFRFFTTLLKYANITGMIYIKP